MFLKVVGVLLGILIGAGCRLLGIPSPAPGALLGALLVVNMCMGFLLMGWFLGKEPTTQTLIAAVLVIFVSAAWIITEEVCKDSAPPPQNGPSTSLHTPADKGPTAGETN